MKKQYESRTKIVATVGPASSDESVMEKMIQAGVDVFRLNFSHSTREEHQSTIQKIRNLNELNDTHTAILADLQGPKLRIGEVESGTVWEKDSMIEILNTTCIGNREKVYLNYEPFAREAASGDIIMVDDGKIELIVTATNGTNCVTAKVKTGGAISSKKGVNLPNTKISLPSLTEKDLADLDFVLENNVEWIALSFVRNAYDIIHLKTIIEKKQKDALVIAKIEKPEAITNFDEILAVADGIMVARGDLGVELPMEEVPIYQKVLVKKCLAAAKPVIIATQMMESMITNSKPTRAEVNDVANAVLDGADALMLSAETTVGKYPVEVIEAMEQIIIRAEKEASLYKPQIPLNKEGENFIGDAVCHSSVTLSHKVGAQAIISMTKSGYTAFTISSFRPRARIYIFSDDTSLLNRMSLIWGVTGFVYNKYESTDKTFSDVIEILREKGFLKSGDIVINTASMPIHEKSRTNALKVSVVE